MSYTLLMFQASISSRSDDVQETRGVQFSRNPVYEEGFIFLVNNPELDHLNLRVYDERSKSTLGLLRLNLANLLEREGREYFNQPFKLKKTGCESSVTLHLQLYFTKKMTGNCGSVSNNPDSISIFSVRDEGGEETEERRGGKKMSVISGVSVENMTFGDDCDSEDTSLISDTPVNPVTLDENETVNSAGPHLLLSLLYDPLQENLILTIHKARDLGACCGKYNDHTIGHSNWNASESV